MIQGHVDELSWTRVKGWVWDDSAPDAPVILRIGVDGEARCRVVADLYRADLKEAQVGAGCHGFDHVFEPALPAGSHAVTLSREGDGAAHPDSPVTLLRNGGAVRAGDPGLLAGHVDGASRERVQGWAHAWAAPDEPVGLVVAVDGQEVARVLANEYRVDLEAAGFGDGRRGFLVAFEPPLSPLRHVVAVRRANDGVHVPGSPILFEDATRFDPAVQEGIAAALGTGGADMRARIGFVAAQLARLLQLRSDHEARRGERLSARQVRRRWVDPATPEPAALSKRALILDLTMPLLGRDAGSAAIVSHAQSLQRLGYEAVLTPMDLSGHGAAALEALGIACCHSPWYGSVEEVLRSQAGCFDLVYLHRVECAFAYMALVRRYNPRARVVFSVADLQHVRLARQAEVEQRPELLAVSRQVGKQELWAALESDAVITHSATEAAVLRRHMAPGRVHTVPWAVPARPSPAPFERRWGVAFVGGYGHAPNVDAALWLLEEVLPLLQAADPAIEVVLVGSAMPEILAQPRPGVVALGQVEDLAGLFDRVRLTVAPLLYGAGLKGKVIESLAAGVPCVCTPVAAEGIALGAALGGLMAGDAAGLAASVARVHGDRRLWTACRKEGLALVAAQYDALRIDTLLRDAVS